MPCDDASTLLSYQTLTTQIIWSSNIKTLRPFATSQCLHRALHRSLLIRAHRAYVPPGTDPNANSTTSNGLTGSGQIISARSSKRDATSLAERSPELLEFGDDDSGYARVKRASAGSCDFRSQTYGMATGDLQPIIDTDDCSFNTSFIYIPLSCHISQVGAGQSW